MMYPWEVTDREMLQRCLVMLEQHDRINKRGWGSKLPMGDLIRDIRNKLTEEELAECDKHVPKAYRR
jgi:hypothetical protein